MVDETTLDLSDELTGRAPRTAESLALVLLWSASEPARVGQVAFVGTEATLGRPSATTDYGSSPLLAFGPHRPDPTVKTSGLRLGRSMSRKQATLRTSGDILEVANSGRTGMRVNGRSASEAQVGPGDVVRFGQEVVFWVARLPTSLGVHADPHRHRFGTPDRHGLVGESVAAWRLRMRLQAVAQFGGHVLVHGESGTGKELAARALHSESNRSRGPYLVRNCAAFSDQLATSELFGHVKGAFTGADTSRQGIFEMADGGTAVLDEFGVLGDRDQARCLRLLENGVVEKVGASKPMSVDVRVIACTNSPLESLRHDVLARLTLRVEMPSLDARREDIPLLAQHLLRRAKGNAPLVSQFFDEAQGVFRLEPKLVGWLVRQRYGEARGNIRRLQGLLETAVLSSVSDPSSTLRLTPEVEALGNSAAAPGRPLSALSRDEVEACLARHDGVQRRAAAELGVSVHALGRRIRKWRRDDAE